MINLYPKGYKFQLSPNFNLVDFHCHCDSLACRVTMVAQELVNGLEALRAIAGPFDINSGYRCIPYNQKINGRPNSYHTVGMAADCAPRFLKPQELKQFAVQVPTLNQGGIGLYKWGIHVDVRPIMSRWTDPNLHDLTIVAPNNETDV